MASATGGISVVNTNEFKTGLDKILAHSSYYLLAYTPVDKFDNKFRKLEVKVKRSGARVYTHRGYVAREDRGAGTAPTLLAIEALKRRGGTMVVQGEGNQEFPSFPIGRLTRKAITLKSARGHSYRAVELALHQLATHRFPLDLMMTHTFRLADVDYAIKSVGGEGAPGAIHVSVMPWK